MKSKKVASKSSVSILKQLIESPKVRIVIKENFLNDNSDFASSKSKKEAHSDVMSVMMADITVEAVMAEMERNINLLMKLVEEQDHEIIALREQMRFVKLLSRVKLLLSKLVIKGRMWCKTNHNNNQLLLLLS
ncbi:ty3-gypsy retrotransposon protein [Cucumis melo var. makuwa]|uniref:Ty3-gypsy retrotransposon protein n=1 Tax=Cucumis melo var. makuwa TaxID=1194695 RepID=A0A5A7UZ82_CUCMM|nr:ty3-gypsy retrotransposon protein [Cucumis melo var. makuwa]